jgi:hypothetical protein
VSDAAAIPPIPFRASGGVMTPQGAQAAKAAARYYPDGETVWLVPHHDRSMKSHRHQFSWIREAFLNLPEHYAGHFMDPDHLRKTALIHCGYRTQRDIVCATEEAALQLAAWAQMKDRYAAVVVAGCVVTILEAESQSQKAMGRERFNESKAAILDYIAGMLGVEPGVLIANAGKAT